MKLRDAAAGFDNDEACREFLESHGAQHIVEKKPDEKGGHQFRVELRKAAAGLEQEACDRRGGGVFLSDRYNHTQS